MKGRKDSKKRNSVEKKEVRREILPIAKRTMKISGRKERHREEVRNLQGIIIKSFKVRDTESLKIHGRLDFLFDSSSYVIFQWNVFLTLLVKSHVDSSL
jgi:hypothetical protein